MSDTLDQDKFDAVLRRLISSKPQTEAETKARAIEIRKARHAIAERQMREAKDSE
jgi:hypothetical protein